MIKHNKTWSQLSEMACARYPDDPVSLLGQRSRRRRPPCMVRDDELYMSYAEGMGEEAETTTKELERAAQEAEDMARVERAKVWGWAVHEGMLP
jgi:hypothetical protein